MITIDLINKVRSKASETYKNAIPIAYRESDIQIIADQLLSCIPLLDEFLRILNILTITYFYNSRGE